MNPLQHIMEENEKLLNNTGYSIPQKELICPTCSKNEFICKSCVENLLRNSQLRLIEGFKEMLPLYEGGDYYYVSKDYRLGWNDCVKEIREKFDSLNKLSK